MSAGCIKCGHCCDPVGFNLDEGLPQLYLRWLAYYGDDTFELDGSQWEKDPAFIIKHWSKTNDGYTQCDKFDKATRTCTAYDERPPVCQGYPWYGRAPDGVHIPPDCSFWADLPPRDRPSDWVPLRNAIGLLVA